ncbi:POL5 rDNA transcriptional regulator POL5 [Candida maltosa Xu316]
MKGKEKRAVLFGRLFGLQVLINSKIILKGDNKEDVEKNLGTFIEILLEISNSKNWIRETGFFTLIQFINLLQEDLKKGVYVKVLTLVNNLGLNLSTEGLAIYLTIPNSNQLYEQIPNLKATWKNGDPFNRGNLQLLGKVLKDVEIVNDEDENEENGSSSKKSKSSWNSRLPFDVETIEKSKKRKKHSPKKSKKIKLDEAEFISVKDFWKIAIDESLFSEKSSNERKYWGFEIFNKFVTSLLDKSQIQYLITGNFLRCLINHHSNSSRFLNKISQITLKTLISTIKENPSMAASVLEALLDESKGGCWNFDLVSKSKTIDEILQTKSEVNSVIPVLLTNLEAKLKSQNVPTEDNGNHKNSNDNIIKWYLDKIVNLIKHNDPKNLLESILVKLIKFSFFKSDTISKFLQSTSKERLNSILSELITAKRASSSSWPYFCYETIQELSKTEECLIELDDEINTTKLETQDILQEIHDSSNRDNLYIFELLFSMCLIQLYMEDEETIQVINELKSVFENQFKEGEETADDSIVLTEIVLSFISRKSTLFKKLAMLIWENYLCRPVDEDGELRISSPCFELLFEVLETKENKQGQEKLFDNDDDQEAEGDDDENDEDDEEDEDDDGDDDDDEEDDEEDDDEDEGENDAVDASMTELDKQTNLKLAQALGIPTKESGEVKFDELDDLSSDGDNYESDSMDDEQMMAMDDELSRIFKQRQDTLNNLATGNKRKLEVLEAKENMIFFKNRILDLLETFTKVTNSQHHYNLLYIKPLINLMNLTLDKNLGVKAHKLLKTRISKTKVDLEQLEKYYGSNLPQYYQTLISLIRELQQNANSIKSSNQSVIQSYNQGCIIIAKNLINWDSDANMKPIVEIYCESLTTWCLDPQSKLQPSLFFDFINWVNSKITNKK